MAKAFPTLAVAEQDDSEGEDGEDDDGDEPIQDAVSPLIPAEPHQPIPPATSDHEKRLAQRSSNALIATQPRSHTQQDKRRLSIESVDVDGPREPSVPFKRLQTSKPT